MTQSRNSIRCLCIAIAVSIWIAGCTDNQRDGSKSNPLAFLSRASVHVQDLRCEYLENPLGIDSSEPQLSWKLAAPNPKERCQRQTAYQILVAGSSRLLAKNRPDLWDSGDVASDQSAHVAYAGRPLSSGMRCYWKARVKDENGIWSQWSKPACWAMGLLEKSDWSAKWIGTSDVFVRKEGWPPPDNSMPDPWFRKTFSLAAKPKSAVIYVASIGYHELYVNGSKIGDAVLLPSVANHRKRARYVTYDITDQLRAGQNVIGLWLGVSWSIFPPYKTGDKPQTPLVIAQAEIDLPNNEYVRIVTDQTWKTHLSPNTLLGVWDFMHFGGELYDANKEMPNWCQADLDDSAWKQASVYSPNVTLSAEMIEPNRRIKEIRPVAIDEVSKDVYRVDMGVNFTGMLEADVTGSPGQAIEFKFSERQDNDMTHRLHSRYIIGPAGKGTFHNRFNYFTGRWIQIEGLKYKPTPDQIRGYLVRTAYERAGYFESSNKLLNDIYDMTLWTYENLSLGGYVVDCPHRERMGYGGDAHATTETALDNYSLGAFYAKWSQDWRDVQGAETSWGLAEKKVAVDANDPAIAGNLPYTAPTFWGGGGPAWSGYCITLPWEFYQQYGDKKMLQTNFPTIERWLAFLETKSKNNMLVRWGGEWDFLGDWLWPGAKGVNGDTRETLFFNNCYWIYNLQTAAKIAEALGKTDQAQTFRSRAEQVRKAVHKEFFDPNNNGYVNNFQAYLSAALLADVPPQELRPAVLKRLVDEIQIHRKGHFWGGITGGYFIVEALTEFDRPDLMFEMATKEDYPGWGDMLKRGATTFWESWEGNISLLHSSYLHIGAWFIEGLAGIRPDPESPGFKHFIIKPGIVEHSSLTWVKASYDSLYGPITSQWKIEGDKLQILVAVPPNTRATLYLPAKDALSITESGKPLSKAKGMQFVRMESERAVLSLDPGRYVFATEHTRIK
jgi:alpha-L-rhamnosidase